jgi:hypothetical protein
LALVYFVVGVVYNLPEAAFRGTHPVWIIFLLAVMALPVSAAQPRGIKRQTPEKFPETQATIGSDVLDPYPAYAGLPTGLRTTEDNANRV